MRCGSACFGRRVLSVGAAVAALMLIVPGHLIGATVWVVSFTIDDAFPNAKVRSDSSASDQVIPYADYRLADPGDEFGCIEAEPTSAGFLHAVLNRKVDEAGTRCNPAGSNRQFRIRLTNAPVACQKLVAAYGAVDVEPGPGAGVAPGPTAGECELVWTANPRIRVTDLFKKGVRATPIAFLADKSGLNGLGYEIQALTSATMAAPSPNRRDVTFNGQGMLSEFGNGKARFVAEAFDMQLRMVFERFAR